jgi:catechol 2,3-dioxygenase-like lactoylglutathione lyase family enzyme
MMSANAASRSGRKQTELFREAEAFSSFSVKDIKQAKQFYGDTLGLKVKDTPEGGLQLNTGGTNVFLYPKPNHTPASFTVLNFHVEDIEAAVKELKTLGIQLEQYDLPDMKTDKDGIFRGPGPQIAWFKDPAGNILSVLEE